MVAYVNSVEVICNRICPVRRERVGRRKWIVCVWIAQHRDSRPKPGFALRLTVSYCQWFGLKRLMARSVPSVPTRVDKSAETTFRSDRQRNLLKFICTIESAEASGCIDDDVKKQPAHKQPHGQSSQ